MRMQTLLWAVTFVMVCGAGTTLIRTLDRTLFRSGGAPTHNVAKMPQFPSAPSLTQTGSIPPATSASDQHWEATKLLSEARVAQREALGHIEQWTAEIEPLGNDESGDAIAVNAVLVEKLAYVRGKQRMNVGEKGARRRKTCALFRQKAAQRYRSLAEKSQRPDSIARSDCLTNGGQLFVVDDDPEFNSGTGGWTWGFHLVFEPYLSNSTTVECSAK